MIRLELAGAHTRLLSTLCSQCPQGPAGCCVSPPELDWTDIGRVVSLGGRGWLLEQIAAGNLVPVSRGLALRRVRRREDRSAPRQSKCVYHGAHGCTIAHERRAATCNYFLCEDAFTERDNGQGERDDGQGERDDGQGERDGGQGERAASARRAHALLREIYARWDAELAQAVAALEGGPSWDEAFLDWLGAEFARRVDASHAELAALR